MSIATEIQRLNTAKADLKAAINLLKGSAIITDETIDEYAGAMAGLPIPAVEEEFVEKTCPHNGPAQLLKIFGKTIVWNQGMPDNDWSLTNWKVSDNATISVTNGVARVTCNSDGTVSLTPRIAIQTIANHKYCVIVFARTSGKSVRISTAYAGSEPSTTSQDFTQMSMISYRASDYTGFYPHLLMQNAVVGDWFEVRTFVLFDLTLLYGAGNEPTSVMQFLADYPTYNPTYDPGSIQSNKTAELRAERTPVINVWDEEWEGGIYNKDTGEKESRSNFIRSTNFIPVNPNTEYYYKSPSPYNPPTYYDRVLFYDSSQVFIDSLAIFSNSIFTTPSNCAFLTFYSQGTNYQHDICINLSNPAINGQYFPHWRGSLQLNLSTLTGKLNGEGASVVVYPDGLRGVGTDRDAAYGSTGVVARAVVDLGTLNWVDDATNRFMVTNFPAKYLGQLLCPILSSHSGTPGTMPDKSIAVTNSQSYPILRAKDSAYTDAATFKAAMSGVMLDYPLATHLTYTLDTPLPTDLTCVQGDILQRVSDNNCPFVGEIEYKL